jgi:hypothetical protein
VRDRALGNRILGIRILGIRILATVMCGRNLDFSTAELEEDTTDVDRLC